MLHKKRKLKEVVVAFTCDRCQKTVSNDQRGIFDFQEAHHIRFTGGYGSVFGDGLVVECDLCQECLLDLIKGFCRVDRSSDGVEEFLLKQEAWKALEEKRVLSEEVVEVLEKNRKRF